MLDLLAKITTAGESFHVTYERQGDDRVRLLIQPTLSDDPDAVTDEDAKKARAALLRPLMFSGTHGEVSAGFAKYVQDNTDSRQSLHDSYSSLHSATKDAAKAAAQAAADKKAKATTKDANATSVPRISEESKPASDGTATADTASNPASLF